MITRNNTGPPSFAEAAAVMMSGGSSLINKKQKDPVLEHLSVNKNDVYLPKEGVDGFDLVEVQVPPTEPVLESLTVTGDGVFTPPEGVDGFDPVIAKFDKSNLIEEFASIYDPNFDEGSLSAEDCIIYAGVWEDPRVEARKGRYMMIFDYKVISTGEIGSLTSGWIDGNIEHSYSSRYILCDLQWPIITMYAIGYSTPKRKPVLWYKGKLESTLTGKKFFQEGHITIRGLNESPYRKTFEPQNS